MGMYRTEGEYFDWINGPVDPAEKLLAEKVGDFSDMFGEMVFEPECCQIYTRNQTG